MSHVPLIDLMESEALPVAFTSAVQPTLAELIQHPFYCETADGSLREETLRRALTAIAPFVYTFPQWMAGSLARLPQEPTDPWNTVRAWMLGNLRIEQRHWDWWSDWMQEWHIPIPAAFRNQTPAVRALMAELDDVTDCVPFGFAALHYGLEGAVGLWCAGAAAAMKRDGTLGGRVISPKAGRWLAAHIAYDATHPIEAAKLLASMVTSDYCWRDIGDAVARVLDGLLDILDECYAKDALVPGRVS